MLQPGRTGFNNVVMTPELTDGDRTHMHTSSATCESDAKPLPRCPELTFRIAFPFVPAPVKTGTAQPFSIWLRLQKKKKKKNLADARRQVLFGTCLQALG